MPGNITQLDGAESFFECNIPIIKNRYQCLQENLSGNAIQGSSGLLHTGLDTSRLHTEEDFKESLWNPWTIMDTHNGRTKQGDSPGKGKGISSESSSSTPSPPKALDSPQPPQISIMSPDMASYEFVKKQSGNEGQRVVEGGKGPSTCRTWFMSCMEVQEVNPNAIEKN